MDNDTLELAIKVIERAAEKYKKDHKNLEIDILKSNFEEHFKHFVDLGHVDGLKDAVRILMALQNIEDYETAALWEEARNQ